MCIIYVCVYVNSHTMHKISMKSNASTCTNLAAEMYLHFAKEMHSLSPVHLHKKNVVAISTHLVHLCTSKKLCHAILLLHCNSCEQQ